MRGERRDTARAVAEVDDGSPAALPWNGEGTGPRSENCNIETGGAG
jgi:hypothetical protein